MRKLKLVFLCHFSNIIIRKELKLRNYYVRKCLMKLRHLSNILYDDYAIWVSDYIEEFEKHPEWDIHIVAPHLGMKRKFQEFDRNGIHYHFWEYKDSLIHSLINKLTNIDKRSDYCYNRNKIQTLISSINPDIVCLCGAENPYYSLGVLDVKDRPVYVILQTFLNDQKRIEMGVGDEYRRECEKQVFQHAGFFCTQDTNAIDYIKKINPMAQILPTRFPTHIPNVDTPKEKNCDFVFFARTITINKGVEDVLKALSLVRNNIKDIKLCLIGSIDKDYQQHLQVLINDLNISDNVLYKGYFKNINDTYVEVMKAKIVVVPGITAPLNSTVRESMLMGQPTICYEDASTIEINQRDECLFIAKMRNVEHLASLMTDAIQNEKKTNKIAMNGKNYANNNFGNKMITNQFLKHCREIIENYNNQNKSLYEKETN